MKVFEKKKSKVLESPSLELLADYLNSREETKYIPDELDTKYYK